MGLAAIGEVPIPEGLGIQVPAEGLNKGKYKGQGLCIPHAEAQVDDLTNLLTELPSANTTADGPVERLVCGQHHCISSNALYDHIAAAVRKGGRNLVKAGGAIFQFVIVDMNTKF